MGTRSRNHFGLAASSILLTSSLLASSLALAQSAAAPQGAAESQQYTAKVKQLSRAEVDALLAKPGKVLFVELRRPDQVSADGSFPVYLAVLAKDLEKDLKYIPRDRTLVTVGLHARYAGRYGDILVSKGFKVAGAVGTTEYQAEGGVITKVAIPPPRNPAANAAAPAGER